jgi:hypothetical protein
MFIKSSVECAKIGSISVTISLTSVVSASVSPFDSKPVIVSSFSTIFFE